MKKTVLSIIFFTIIQSSFSQEKNNTTNHKITFDFGSYRNRYLYSITDIKYNSPVLKKININFSARIRSYGTLYFFSKSAYDFTPIMEYFIKNSEQKINFSAGVGLDTRIRLTNDIRSDAQSSAEPLFSFTTYINYKKFQFNTPIWTRFYTNGVTFTVIPEVSFQISNKFALLFRYEISYLKIYNITSHEFQRDCFLGASISL